MAVHTQASIMTKQQYYKVTWKPDDVKHSSPRVRYLDISNIEPEVSKGTQMYPSHPDVTYHHGPGNQTWEPNVASQI